MLRWLLTTTWFLHPTPVRETPSGAVQVGVEGCLCETTPSEFLRHDIQEVDIQEVVTADRRHCRLERISESNEIMKGTGL